MVILFGQLAMGVDMNWYSVQFVDSNGMVSQWTQADTHLGAAGSVLLDRGFYGIRDAKPTTPIMVVRKHDYLAGSYTLREVEHEANKIVGLLMPSP
jgi:hypothetical protein